MALLLPCLSWGQALEALAEERRFFRPAPLPPPREGIPTSPIQDPFLELEHSLALQIEDHPFWGPGQGLEYQLVFPWEFPLNFGLGPSFHVGPLREALYFGAFVRALVLKLHGLRLHLQLGAQRSLVFSLPQQGDSSSHAWEARGEVQWKLWDALFFGAVSWRWSSTDLDKGPFEGTVLSLGHRFGGRI